MIVNTNLNSLRPGSAHYFGCFLHLMLMLASPVIYAGSFFVSESAGNSGDGSFTNPWKLQTAFDQPVKLKPGDTVWLRAGNYSNTSLIDPSLGAISYNCKTNGKQGQPIIFRNYNNERVTLDGKNNQILLFLGNCSYTWFWGLEMMSSAPQRKPDRSYIYCTAPDLKFINLILHDLADGIDLWNAAKQAELYGCIIYHNGWDEINGGHGHGIYTQSDTTNIRLIHNNIFFSSFGYNLKLWSTNQGIDNFDIRNNIVFNGGSYSEVIDSRKHNFFIVSNNPSRPIKNLIMKQNYTYAGKTTTTGSCNNIGANYGSVNMVLDSNYFLGQLRLAGPYENFTATGNKIYGGTELPALVAFGTIDWNTWKETEYSDSIPTEGVEYFVIPNKYEPDLAHMVIYNWEKYDYLDLVISELDLKPGDQCELIQVMDYYNDRKLIYVQKDGSLRISMNDHTFARAIGSNKDPVSQFPLFGVFIIRKTGKSVSELKRVSDLFNVILQPNPFKDRLNIIISGSEIRIDMVRIIDQNGKLIQTLKSQTNNFEVSGQCLPKGLYYLQLYSKNELIKIEPVEVF